MNVVIVESPAKAKTINKYLGKDYIVLASYGHVRDLPPKDGSVLPDDDFAMSWAVDSKSQKRLSEIADAVKGADRLILATDPDREGEAISWHVLEVLKKKRVLKDKKIERVVFNAITKNSVLEAMQNPRELDVPLVDAYLARRALDYLVGFTLSPVLWRKLPGARSAGRVQSVSLRLVCQREVEIESFKSQEYWSILANLNTPESAALPARLTGFDGKKITRLDITSEGEATTIKKMLESASFNVANVESKPQKRNPYAPFTTSTLQQEASRKLGFAAARTMQVAQKLYEGANIGGETTGLITYMRTDGVQIAPEAIESCRSVIASKYGKEYVPEKPRVYTVKAKNAQEAHEAIRPTELTRHPRDMAKVLDEDGARLYELVWKRTIASQMASAVLERTTIDIDAADGSKKASLRASGSVVRFDGFLALYQEGKDDEEDEESRRLPAVNKSDKLDRKGIEASQHFTEPPPRFTEATLVKKMEELGIGRPSTYAATLQTLRDREYVDLDKKRLIPQDKGRLVIAFLEDFFNRYVEYDFTASLEDQLDKISAGELEWKAVLRDFWNPFHEICDEVIKRSNTEVLDSLNESLKAHVFPVTEEGQDPRKCPTCETGRLSLKVSRYGAFVGCSNYNKDKKDGKVPDEDPPHCGYTRQLVNGGGGGDADADGTKVLGLDPVSGLEVSLRRGRFGPYVQLGEEAKPKRSSLPKGWDAADLDLEKALELLSLPREVGEHPEDGKMISAGLGRFGPFVLHDGTYANLDGPEEVFTVGINRAVTLLAEKRAKGGGRGAAAKALKELGNHPDGGAINVYPGRYGPYVKWEKINATLPKDVEPEAVTLEQAIELVNAKAGSKGKKKAPAKKAAAKKTTAKKAAPKGALKEIGDHPDGGTMELRDSGRLGVRIKWGKEFISLPKGTDPETVTREQAIELINAKKG
ncbi:type I DNA topoisomerase [Pseudovibrio sp. Tun.PSC04-5.I4]|uniref:type I DNA topoisomerase n=1 Tax=Pseudovibrio sp. Tun.PSC04-5.I4 TaxID=1798213 RepID=UPI00088EA64E|nr:type I DNA topoisomerase [Pseudovibrio sp. Tun.PSC04-5.I4]SDR39426.1 DNA topoisomerase I [Pseudovibrio sp. Tun.PSC04-5.I4]